MQADVNNEEDIPEFSDSETVAVSIYFAGMLSMAQFFMLEFEDAFTENTAAGDETEDEPSALRNAGNGADRLPGKRIGIKEENRQFANPSPAIPKIPKSCKS